MELSGFITKGISAMGGVQALADYLGIDRTLLAHAKAHRKGLPNSACVKLAGVIDEEALVVIAASELVTEKNPERRAVWIPLVEMAEMKTARRSEPSGDALVGRARFELATNGLKVRCSTD